MTNRPAAAWIVLARSTAILATSNLLGAGLIFLLSALIGRALGVAALGVYATVLAWLFPLTLMVEFGLGTLLIRTIAQEPTSHHRLVQQVVRQRWCLGGGTALALILLAPWLSASAEVVAGLRISAPLVIAGPMVSVYTAVFRAHHDMRPVAWLNVGMLVSQLGLSLLAVLAGGDILSLLIINTVTSIGQWGAAWAMYGQRYPAITPTQPNDQPTSRLTRQGMPFAIAGVVSALHQRIGFIALEWLASPAQVGFFSAASRCVEIGRLPAQAFYDALYPTLTSYRADPAGLRQLFWRATLVLSAGGVAFGVCATIGAELALKLIFGEDFATGGLVLQVLGWSLLPLLMRSIRILYWYALGHEAWVNKVLIWGLLIRVSLCLPLASSGGAVGLALAMTFSECALVLGLWLGRPPNH